ncbi:MAG: hypothetical protein AAB359_01905, partial [Elusimicrobiota bacterium]
QTLSPLPQTYFAVYDIGGQATKANKVGLMVRDKSWLTVNVPHEISPDIYIGVTRSLPRGDYLDTYPFSSSMVTIRAITLVVSGSDMAPEAVEKNAKKIPLMTLKLTTLSDYVAIGQVNFIQTGSISSATAGYGDGDFSGISLWKDDGDEVFSPIRDARLSFVVHSATNPFKPGIEMSIADGNLPYIIVSTTPVMLHLSCDIGSATDLSGADIIKHLAGLSLNAFADLRGVSGLSLSAAQNYDDTYPVSSGQLLISPAVIPLSSVYSPIIIASNGYPAYAVTDSSGNVVLGADEKPVADTSRWIYNYPGTACGPSEPLIDINGDGRPDNFDYTGSGKCSNLSLTNSGKPSFDINGDKILDFDFNNDNVADIVTDDGSGNLVYKIGRIASDGSQLMPRTVPSIGVVPSVWSSNTTELAARWNPASGPIVAYWLAVGSGVDTPYDISNGWQNVGASLSGKIPGLSMTPVNAVRLNTEISMEDDT